MISYPHNKYNNNERVWNGVRICDNMWHRDSKWADVVGKIPIDLLDTVTRLNVSLCLHAPKPKQMQTGDCSHESKG